MSDYLEARFGKEAVQLMTVPPDGRCDNGKGKEPAETPFDSATELQNHETERRLRAILRAPRIVRDLYRQGLVSQARSGPTCGADTSLASVWSMATYTTTLYFEPAQKRWIRYFS